MTPEHTYSIKQNNNNIRSRPWFRARLSLTHIPEDTPFECVGRLISYGYNPISNGENMPQSTLR